MKVLLNIISVVILGIFLACNLSVNNNTNKSTDSLSTGQNKQPLISKKSNDLKDKILGFWIPKGEPEGIEIRKDSIYYVTVFKSYKYVVTKDDTLEINFDGYINKSKLLMKQADTLISIGQDTIYYIRSK